MGQHLAGMLHQDPQQIVFLRRKLHLAFADLDDAAHQIDREIAGAKHRAFAMDLQLVAQRRPHPRQQFVHAERLGEIIVGAEIERLQPCRPRRRGSTAPRSERCRCGRGSSATVMPLDVGQAEIENDQRRVFAKAIRDRSCRSAPPEFHSPAWSAPSAAICGSAARRR